MQTHRQIYFGPSESPKHQDLAKQPPLDHTLSLVSAHRSLLPPSRGTIKNVNSEWSSNSKQEGAEKSNSTRFLRHREDRRSISFVLATVAFQTISLAALGRHAGVGANLLGALFLSVLCSIAMVINHNHIHTPFFKSQNLNRFFSLLISVAEGLSSKFLTVAHNYNHHVYSNTEKDWCYEKNAGKGPGLVRVFRYIGVTWTRMFQARTSPDAPKTPRRFKEQEILEHLFILLFTVCSLIINPIAFAVVILPGWLISAGFITLTNLIQHEECDPESTYNHSRNLVGQFSNWLLFNAGYHTAHHLKPSIHWSKLPEVHQEYLPQISPHLNEPSLVGFLLRQYVFRWR